MVDLTEREDWPSSSPDLNPLDFKFGSVWVANVCQKQHPKPNSLKRSLRKAAMDILMEVVQVFFIDDWPKRFNTRVNSKEDHFE
ncbi:hypothetical protein TNCV_3148371 [Trichonephila clavipes]|nr:hypothetical protein TNCV_3148371 [Trichonephila clavipes]